jgi:hypothetical protein
MPQDAKGSQQESEDIFRGFFRGPQDEFESWAKGEGRAGISESDTRRDSHVVAADYLVLLGSRLIRMDGPIRAALYIFRAASVQYREPETWPSGARA